MAVGLRAFRLFHVDMSGKRLVIKLFFALTAALVFFVGYSLGNRYARPGRDDLQAFVMPEPMPIEAVALEDEAGRPFTTKDLEGHWNLVMAGDLGHPACRALLVRYVLAWNWLADTPKLQEKTRVVFVDTATPPRPAEARKRLIDFYNPAFVALGGPVEAQRRLLTQLGVPAQALAAGVPCDDARSVVALIGPDAHLLALFTGMDDAKAIAHDLKFFR